MWLFLTVPWVGMQCVIVVSPGYTHLRFAMYKNIHGESQEEKSQDPVNAEKENERY